MNDFCIIIKNTLSFFILKDHEARLLLEARKGAIDENFSGRIKNLEEKLKGTITDKKPKDLRRAIGIILPYIIFFNKLYFKCSYIKNFVSFR